MPAIQVESKHKVHHPASQAWAILSDFTNARWLGANAEPVKIEDAGQGITREFSWETTSAKSVQRLDELDRKRRRLVLTVLQSPHPFLINAQADFQINPISKNTCSLKVTITLPEARGANLKDLRRRTWEWGEICARGLECVANGELRQKPTDPLDPALSETLKDASVKGLMMR